MHDHAQLSKADWQLVIALLQREQSELPTEIQHTRSASVRDKLLAQQKAVDNLLERLKSPAVMRPRCHPPSATSMHPQRGPS